ncbi:hypothetical protein SAMN04488523_10236 [Sulfitobacter brevis]|uniref:Uncharacterized protein n=1 Tax=Sulfitobacter brevis TaxID=74348 RepID=A0A1I1UA49_9RHOB|nr:hypothetical protein [Sulfitobacter brevis]SFD67617.1 hypothetical protein SAMN04488523_10236 [Sulfitobacter brevis]
MELPAAIQGESLTRLLQGFGLGAVVAMGVGFGWGGWTLASTAADQTETETTAAVVAALAPICVKEFKADAQASVNMTALMEESSYKRDDMLEKAGWATFAGSDKPTPGVAKECAERLTET